MPQNVVESLEQIHTHRGKPSEKRDPYKCNDSTEFTFAFPQIEACGSIGGQAENHGTEE